MKKKNQALHKMFGRLQAEASKVRVQGQSVREATYKHFAGLYFWWLPAEKTGVLDNLYKQRNIKFKRPSGNRINFVPLLKLVWDNKISSRFADRWSRALNEIHAEVQASQAHYQKEGVKKLANWIGTKGGPSKLSGYFPESGQQKDSQPAETGGLEGLAEQEILRLLLAEANSWYSNPTAGARASLPSSQPVKIRGFGLELFHNNGVSSQFVASWLNPAQIESAVIDCYRGTFTALPPDLRFLAELIHLRSVPRSLAKVADKVRKSSLGGSEWRDLFTLRSAQNDVLISPTKGASGVVINAALPPNFALPFLNDLFLPRYCTGPIERKLLLPMIFNLITTKNGQGFLPVAQANVAVQALELAWKEPLLNRASAYYPGLRLPSLLLCPFYKGIVKVTGQVQCAGFKSAPTFSHAAKPMWVQKINVEFFDDWVRKYGAKANRETNFTLAVIFDPKGIFISYEYFDSTGYDTTVFVEFDQPAQGQAVIIVRSTDFAFLMRQIADLTLTTDIAIEASSELITLRFSTAAGNYTGWIPACNRDGVRTDVGFSRYSHQLTALAVDDALDDEEPFIT